MEAQVYKIAVSTCRNASINRQTIEFHFNKFKEKNMAVEINLDFFVSNGDSYYRTGESFCERAYTKQEIEVALQKAGLKIEAVYDDMTQNTPSDTAERIIYVTRKV